MSSLHLEPVPAAGLDEKPSGKSAMDRIRAIYAKAKGEQILDLAIPRNPVMGVRYRAIDPDDYDTTATKSRDQMLDLLIQACDCILVRDGKGWVPLEHNGQPVGFDEALVEIAGLDVKPFAQGGTARQTVLAAFGTAPVPAVAAATHFQELTSWMAGEGPVDEEAVLGES